MSLETQNPQQHQTPWPCGPGGKVWWANIHADVYDETVIDQAKCLVDAALPQKLSTYFGGHYYSFVTREYLLNLILFYHQDHGLFPSGAVCVVEQWAWQGESFIREGKWWFAWFWRFKSRDTFKAPGFWVELPKKIK